MVLTVAANYGSVTIGNVYDGATKLTKTTDYTVAGGVVTLLKARVAAWTAGKHTVKITTDQGDVTSELTVVDTTEE